MLLFILLHKNGIEEGISLNTYLADRIGNMVVSIIEFLLNLAPGYITMFMMGIVGVLIFVIFDNFRNIIIKPKW